MWQKKSVKSECLSLHTLIKGVHSEVAELRHRNDQKCLTASEEISVIFLTVNSVKTIQIVSKGLR